jgi:hypothetical protein
MRQTQPGNVQADNPFLLTARLDTGVASGIVGFPTPGQGDPATFYVFSPMAMAECGDAQTTR